MSIISKVKYAIATVVAVCTMAVATPALAAPDVSAAVEAVNGITTSTDAVGNAFITVVVGIVVFGFIIGMLWRKGK